MRTLGPRFMFGGKMIDRNWWKDAEETACVETRTKLALDALLEQKGAEAKKRIEFERNKKKKSLTKPVLLQRLKSTSYWADMFEFSQATISGWCKEGVIEAECIRGHWRISEAAMIVFLEKERIRRVSEN